MISKFNIYIFSDVDKLVQNMTNQIGWGWIEDPQFEGGGKLKWIKQALIMTFCFECNTPQIFSQR